MKLEKYESIIALSDDDKKKALAPARANQTKKQCELKIAELDSSIVEIEQRITEISAQYPLQTELLQDSLDDLELTKRRRDQLKGIVEQMF